MSDSHLTSEDMDALMKYFTLLLEIEKSCGK